LNQELLCFLREMRCGRMRWKRYVKSDEMSYVLKGEAVVDILRLKYDDSYWHKTISYARECSWEAVGDVHGKPWASILRK